MADSDGDYQGDDGSDDDFGDHQVSSGARQEARAHSKTDKGKKSGRKGGKAAWEDIQRSWDAVVEGADGTLAGTIEGLAEAEKRARLLKDTTPLQRGIIRHLVLVLDMSFAMAEKDLLPSRYELSMVYASEFVREYFEQNPISQLAVLGMRDGVAVRISDMSGNPADHLEKLEQWVKQEPQGNPSLQNALEMCRGALFHTPSHGTREVVIVYGALMSSDPGDIHETLQALVKDRIRVSIVGLAARVAICEELVAKTNGGDAAAGYNIALHEQHFRDLLLAVTTPPVVRSVEQSTASLLMMGFPSRTLAAGRDVATTNTSTSAINYCACHNRPTREGYACTRCGARVCRLPAECPGCGLTLILSTHLARSYHHLFPLRNWGEVTWAEARRRGSRACYACLAPFPEPPPKHSEGKGDGGKERVPVVAKGLSESGRYACEVCRQHFCIDCDLFAHEVLHNCPGCQSDTRQAQQQKKNKKSRENGETNGAPEPMDIDA
ncbi:Ssl1-like-domain-containing protein [Xylariomycetidae sp. FL0641]|nr:Ssl1-like-domain-containing protein [Xylariomycetidae sp. FL0641]